MNQSRILFLTRTMRNSGGARRDRTDDLKLAKLALSQLSYGPVPSEHGHRQAGWPKFGWPEWTRTTDLTLIRRVL